MTKGSYTTELEGTVHKLNMKDGIGGEVLICSMGWMGVGMDERDGQGGETQWGSFLSLR